MRPIDADAVIDSVDADIAKFKTVIDEKAPYYVAAQMMYIAGEVKESIKGYLAKAPTLDYAPNQQWISVKDRLPEEKTAVLGFGVRSMTYLENGPFPATHIVYSRGEDEGWFTFWNGEYVDVTHWMPLPEAPKEEEG